jgi:endonuclease I
MGGNNDVFGLESCEGETSERRGNVVYLNSNDGKASKEKGDNALGDSMMENRRKRFQRDAEVVIRGGG